MALKNSLRVMTWNILAPCYTTESLKPHLWIPRMKKCMEYTSKADADIICFQEVYFHPKMMELVTERFPNYHKSVFQRPGIKKDGLIILSKIPFESTKTLSNITMGSRIAVAVNIELGIQQITIATTHISFIHEEIDNLKRIKQINEVQKWLNNIENDGIILAGDMNGDSTSEVYKILNQEGWNSGYKEINGDEPTLTHLNHLKQEQCVDFIFYKNLIPIAAATLPNNNEKFPINFYSDHLALIVDFLIDN